MGRWLSGLEPWGVLLLRVVLGVAMLVHGYGKVVPAHGLHGDPTSALRHFAHFVQSLGMPVWLGYVSALTEFVGGMLLVLGLLVRPVALLVSINMLVALFAVDLHGGYGQSEYALALLAMAAMLLFSGAGAMSLDRRIGLS